MKKIYTIIAIILFVANAFAQPSLTWVKQFGSSGTEQGISIAYDATGNVYTTGNFNLTTDFDPGPGVFNMTPAGSTDMFVSKLDAAGNFVWAKKLGGPFGEQATSIVIDLSGNVLTTGQFQGTADFDPGPGVSNLTAFGGLDIYISKLDASGNFVWAKQLGGTNVELGYSITTDATGNVYSTGYFAGTGDFDPGAGVFNMTSTGNNDIFISKLDASGSFVWAKQLAGTLDDYGKGIKVDASSNVYTTGYFNGTADFDPGAGVYNLTAAVSVPDIFVSKLDVSGNFVFAKQLASNCGGYGNSIALDASSNIYTTGFFCGTNDFDPGAAIFNLTSIGSSDTYISKLDPSGNFLWAKQFGGVSAAIYGRGIALDITGNVYIDGDFNSASVDFDPSVSIYTLNPSGSDVFISKLSPTGNFSWAVQLGGSSNEAGFGIAVDASNNIYTTGSFIGTADFDPSLTVLNLTSAGGNDAFVYKMACSIPSQPSSINGSANVCSGNTPSYSVVPVAGATSYTWTLPGGWTGSSSTNIINTTASATSGNITVSASNACGTSVVQTLSVTVNSIPPTPGSISGLTSLCTGAGASNYSIAAVAGATSYTWSLAGGWSGASSTNIISATPGSSGIFTVTASNACGTSAQQTLSVTVNPLPTITVNSGSICSGNSFTIVPSGANTYTIQGGSAIVSPTSNASYTVIGTSTAGCISSTFATSNITVNATPTINVAGGAICPGNSFTLNPSGANTYTFSSGPVVSPTITTTYSITGTSIAGCVSNGSAVATVTVANTLTVTITGSNTICNGQAINLTAGGATSYTWNTGATTTTIAPTPSVNTTYSVIGASGSCSNTSILSVTVNPTPTISAVTNNTLLCVGQSATITASGASTYTFNPGGAGASISVSPTVTATYTITGANSFGCMNSTTFTQNVSACTGINQIVLTGNEINIYPNPFINKITIVSSGEKQMVQIFNTLGSLVHNTIIESEKIEINLTEQPSGIYFICVGSVTKKLIKE